MKAIGCAWWGLLPCLFWGSVSGAAPAPDVVRVLSFNLWHGGDAGKQPLEQTVAVIRESQADVVGLQETTGIAPDDQPRPDRAAEIAERLGWHYVDQGSRTGILSRFPAVAVTPQKSGVKLQLPSGQQLYVFNVHFAASPYQPYQLLQIPYGGAGFLKTADEAVQAAIAARGAQVERLLSEVKAVLPEGLPMFVTGDFNEPSYLDWTADVASAKLCPKAVDWPSTRAVAASGFVDTYRQIHPDPVRQRGLTWTPTTKPDDPKDRHDRIDFVFLSEGRGKVRSVRIVGESQETADLVVSPYPSDHRAVVAEVELPPAEKRAPE